MTEEMERLETNLSALSELVAFSTIVLDLVPVRATGASQRPRSPFSWIQPTPIGMLLMAATGVLAGSAQYCLTEAFRVAPPSVVAPFEYTSLLWAMLFGFLVWGDVPSTLVLVSAAVVIASGIDLLRNERATQTRKREEPQPVILPPGA